MDNQSNDSQASAEKITHHGGKVNIPNQELEDMIEELQTIIENIMAFAPEATLSDSDRQRLRGSGVRRYGFIDKVSDVAKSNPEFVPSFMDTEELKKLLRDIENLRNMSVVLRRLARLNMDLFLLISDDALRIALMYYGAVRDAARRRVPGAREIFQTLQLFFRRPSRPTEEPTEMELEHDVRALIHGKKDGKIIIENERPHLTGGKHLVVDEIHKNKIGLRESESEEGKE